MEQWMGDARSHWRRRCALFIVLSGAFGPVLGEDYVIESYLNTRVTYDDNVSLVPAGESGVFQLTVEPAVHLDIKESWWETQNGFRVRGNMYTEDQLDNNELFLVSTSSLTRERSQYRLEVDYSDRSSFSSDSSDFGLAPTRVNRKSLSFVPSYGWLIDRKHTLGISFTIDDAAYERNDVGFTSYRSYITALSLTKNTSELTSLVTRLRQTLYSTDDGLAKYEITNLSLTYNQTFTERMSGYIGVGYSDRKSESRAGQFDFFGTTVTRVGIESESEGLNLDIGFSYSPVENDVLSMSASLSDETSSFGGLDEKRSLSFTYKSELSPVTSWKIESKYQDVESLTDGIKFSDRTFLTTEISLTKKLTRQWFVGGYYRHTMREFKTSSSAPDSSRFSVQARYTFSDFSLK